MASVEDINDEEAFVEDEPNPSFEEPQNDQVFVQDSYINHVMAYLSNPWVLLLIAIAVYYLIQKLELNIKYQNWREQRQYAAEAEHVKKNPDLYRARMEAMEKARQKQQEAHDIAARELAEKERQKEEERRAQKVEQLENLLEGKGYNNKSGRTGESEKPSSTTKVNKTKSNFRSDYNPLMGNSGGSSRYRPDRRSAAGGGG